ncbi:MAG: cupin domain-containing protein [Alphaproteobacteria bacterium]|nr:cupin domain-containing protein [Alphaproteobacteria bacterium]
MNKLATAFDGPLVPNGIYEPVPRQWGDYLILAIGPSYKVKVLTLRPSAAISLQRHTRRSEHWVVLEGEAEAVVNDKIFAMRANDALDVPCGAIHRLKNIGTTALRVVEVQSGSYVEEDDIERFDV